jgi:LemA protein
MNFKLIILIVVVLVCVLYFILTNNKLIKLSNQVKEAFSTMDVYLKKRWDLIPNIVEVVKGYAKHEEKTLTEVTELRSSTYNKMSVDEKLHANEELSNKIAKMMLLVEAYPDLKANENFKDLSKQLTKVEDEIAQSRKYYNATVRDFNNKVEMFPSNVVAMILGYKKARMFEIDAIERENVKVEL